MTAADLPVFDGHNDIAYHIADLDGTGDPLRDITLAQPDLHTDLPRLRTGGVGAQFWSIYVPSNQPEPEAVRQTLVQLDLMYRLIAANPADLRLARTAGDVRNALRDGKIASLMGVEGGHSIGSDLGVLRMLARLGMAYLTLTHNDDTPWADSATGKHSHGGLTDVGREVVRELNRLGVLVDLSHVSAATMADALDVTAKPVIFSHSSARALCDVPRNVPDDILARLSTNGGVCMVALVPQFLNPACATWQESSGEPRPVATAAHAADHIEHIREVAGLDHIGIGGDYDGCDVMPADLPDVSSYPHLFDELATRGWSAAELRQVAWDNALRVLGDSAG